LTLSPIGIPIASPISRAFVDHCEIVLGFADLGQLLAGLRDLLVVVGENRLGPAAGVAGVAVGVLAGFGDVGLVFALQLGQLVVGHHGGFAPLRNTFAAQGTAPWLELREDGRIGLAPTRYV
jgi:hypothetical protein